MAAVISVSGLTKRFGAVTALVAVDLEVNRGEVVALVGPNGAGKSTLLRILGTTVLPDSGVVKVAGHDVTRGHSSGGPVVGFLLADERAWYWRLTGRQNLEFFAALHGLGRSDSTRRAQELLSEVGLEDAADRPFGGYSSGMRLRLSLARALLADPTVLLLDEPTRSLDAAATKHFREVILEVTEQRDAAVLFATHDLEEAAALASRTVILVAGRVATVLDGTNDKAALEQAMLQVTQ